MAGGMGVIDSSGKVGQAIQGMVNQAKAGNLGQARDHKLYLENLVKGMRLDHQRKEITRANQERTAAESALRDSQTKLQALNSKFLEEKYSNDVDRQDKLRRWDFNLKQVKYFEDRVAKGVTLTPGEYAQLQRARAALTGSEIADGTQTQIFDYGARNTSCWRIRSACGPSCSFGRNVSCTSRSIP